MRIYGAMVALLIPGAAALAEESDSKAVAIGPWQIEASFTGAGKFDRCVMSRTNEDGVETRFTRDEGGMSFAMTSPRWRLEKGKTYTVEFAADTQVWQSEVAATNNAVRVVLTDAAFNDGLKTADVLEVRAAGATIRVPLDKSAAALSRLASCYETNSKAVETNPFAKPNPKP